MKSIEYTHAIKCRPKDYSARVWESLVSKAILDKAWALNIIKNKPEWAHSASDASIKMLGERLHKSVIQLARESYIYLKNRAFGQSYSGALCPSARRKWESLTLRRVPPSQYWLYDHSDAQGANLFKFNVARGYGWIKKTKKELKAESIAKARGES